MCGNCSKTAFCHCFLLRHCIPDKYLECLDWDMRVSGLLLLRRLALKTLLVVLGFQYIPNVNLFMEGEPALKQLWPR